LEHFYETVLRTLGSERTYSAEALAESNDLSLSRVTDQEPVMQRLHIGFFARSSAHVDEFWHVGSNAGYRDDGAPGPRCSALSRIHLDGRAGDSCASAFSVVSTTLKAR
jgi:hypothetical protein